MDTPSTRPTWTYVFDSICKLFGLAVPVAGFFWIALPAREDESRLAILEAQVKEIGIEQSQIESRAKAARASIVEHQAAQLRRPAVQVTPKIEQFGSIEDIREIRLSLLLANVGDADADVRKISVYVDDGAPTLQVAEILVRTQQYFYRRMAYVNRQATYESTREPTPVDRAEYVAPAGDKASTDEFDRLNNYYDWLSLPPQSNCPHGRIFAIGAQSSDVQWTPVENVSQVLNRQQVLRPQQSATHHFTFLLTEYPLQHNRQWIRFRIIVGESAEQQEYALLVSGLPLPSCSNGTTVAYQCCSQSDPCVWEPDAPLMPINSDGSYNIDTFPAPQVE